MSEYYLGIDLHKKRSFAVLMNGEGRLLHEGAVPNERMREFLGLNVPASTTAVMEATFNWPFMYDLASEYVEQVLLAHPQKVKMIAEATVKTDKIDARTLAHLARAGYLPTAYAAPRAIRELRHLLRHRANLVADRTRHKNRIQSVLTRHNLTPPVSDLFGVQGRAFLQDCLRQGLSAPDRRSIDDNLAAVDFIDRQVAELKRFLQEQVHADRQVALLQTLPGVGLITAATIRAELGEVERFPSADRAARWAGLTPSVRASDETVHRGPISREGSVYLREAMVGAALRAVRYSASLRQFHDRIARRRGVGMARVALARKMLEIAYYMLRSGQPFREAGG
jgi:transposase